MNPNAPFVSGMGCCSVRVVRRYPTDEVILWAGPSNSSDPHADDACALGSVGLHETKVSKLFQT